MPTAAAPRGQLANLLLKDQASYATAASGNYHQTIFYSDELADLAAREADPILGTARTNARDAQPTSSGLPQGVAGDLSVPLDLNHIWYWLKGAFGAPTTTGSDPDYVHTFVSGGEVLPHRTLEAKRAAALFYQRTGCLISALAGDMAREAGYARANVSIMGRKESKLTSSGGGTPIAILDRDPVPKVIAVAKIDTAIVDIISLSWNYNNGAKVSDEMGDPEGYPVGHDLDDEAMFSGSFRARFRNASLYDLARAGSTFALELLWQKSSARLFSLSAPLVRLDPVGVPVGGPGRVEMNFNFKAEQDASDAMLTAVLKNGLAASAYA